MQDSSYMLTIYLLGSSYLQKCIDNSGISNICLFSQIISW